MDNLHIPRPDGIPADLAAPTPSYKRHAWLALFGLAGFVGLYLSLTVYFCWTAYRLGSEVFSGRLEGLSVLLPLPAAFFAVFMLKGLFFIRRGGSEHRIEVTADEEPRLFAFLHQLADDVGAPRAHRVFLSPDVNAAVFYDLSIANLVLPSKKNLEIGLGAVNALSLGELKAVLAHEFGHFAQRSMAVGTWFYTAQQIAAHIVGKRDALDKLLDFLSGIDLRVAWIGWLMRLVVWALRAVLETALSLAMLAERALSREMEFQADLVAASMTGSDALVHALHKLHAGDEAWDRALHIGVTEQAAGKGVQDLFVVQSRVIERLRGVFDDPTFGVAPPLPAGDRAAHRVFEQNMAQAPKMWSTHPPNHEREENVKRRYIASPDDGREAWLLFKEPERTRKEVSAHILRLINEAQETPRAEPTTPMSEEQVLALVDEKFSSAYLDRRYRGAYLGRSTVRDVKSAAELYSATPGTDLSTELDGLYPESLSDELERARNLLEEKGMLEALRDGRMQATGGAIRHRGRELKRRELPGAIEEVGQECEQARKALAAHDARVRATHRAVAAKLGRGWEEHLVGLASLLHFADHAEANIDDAMGHLNNVLAVVLADGRVSGSERRRLVAAATEAHDALFEVYRCRDEVVLCPKILEDLEVASFREALPDDFGLSTPHEDHIGEFLDVLGGWSDAINGTVGAVRSRALAHLLSSEAHVERCFRDGTDPGDAPSPGKVPGQYRTLVPGTERERQRKLDLWDRFQTADGLVPGTARFAVAASIVLVAMGFGNVAGSREVIVYNGLGRPVSVSVGEYQAQVAPFGTSEVELPSDGPLTVEARTAAGELIESFNADSSEGGQLVYNVAGAAPLLEWTMTYGSASERPDRKLGAPRWTSSSADVMFEEPPESVRTKFGGATRDVLVGLGDIPAQRQLELLESDEERARVAAVRARWALKNGPHAMTWLHLASQAPAFKGVLQERLAADPNDVLARRLQVDTAPDEAARTAACEQQQALARAAPDNVDLSYLSVRCLQDEQEKDAAFVAGNRAHPEHPWFAFASAYVFAQRAQWDQAASRFEVAVSGIASMAEHLMVDYARVVRMRDADAATPKLKSMATRSNGLRIQLALESGEDVPPGHLRAYAQLAQGKLAEAVQTASSDPETHARVQRLAAASDGADESLVAQALALPVELGLTEATVWSAVGLAARQGGELAPFRELAQQSAGDMFDVIWSFTDAKALRSDLEAANERLLGLGPSQRGFAVTVGAVVLGKDAPAQWRRESQALLFAANRPYFEL